MTNIELQAFRTICSSLPIIAQSLEKISGMVEKLATDFSEISEPDKKEKTENEN